MDPSNLKLMAAMIAGGIVSSHGLDPEIIAERSIRIAMEIDSQVDALPRSGGLLSKEDSAQEQTSPAKEVKKAAGKEKGAS